MHFPSFQNYKTLFYKFGQGVTRLILHVSLLQPAQECITGMGFMCSHTHSLDKHQVFVLLLESVTYCKNVFLCRIQARQDYKNYGQTTWPYLH